MPQLTIPFLSLDKLAETRLLPTILGLAQHQSKSAAPAVPPPPREVPGRDEPATSDVPEEPAEGTERVDAAGGAPERDRARARAGCKLEKSDVGRGEESTNQRGDENRRRKVR